MSDDDFSAGTGGACNFPINSSRGPESEEATNPSRKASKMLELLLGLWNVATAVATIVAVSLGLVGALCSNVWRCVHALGKLVTGLSQIVQFFVGNPAALDC